MAYNLLKHYPNDFHPHNEIVWPDITNTKIGFLEQNGYGIIDSENENKDILAPFNIACYSFKSKIYIQIYELNTAFLSCTATTFCSPKPRNSNSLPKAAIQSIKYVFDNYPAYACTLFHVIIAAVGVEMFEDELNCWHECLEKVHELFNEINSEETDLTPVEKGLFQSDDTPM